jgi:hypothetical protein
LVYPDKEVRVDGSVSVVAENTSVEPFTSLSSSISKASTQEASKSIVAMPKKSFDLITVNF